MGREAGHGGTVYRRRAADGQSAQAPTRVRSSAGLKARWRWPGATVPGSKRVISVIAMLSSAAMACARRPPPAQCRDPQEHGILADLVGPQAPSGGVVPPRDRCAPPSSWALLPCGAGADGWKQLLAPPITRRPSWRTGCNAVLRLGSAAASPPPDGGRHAVALRSGARPAEQNGQRSASNRCRSSSAPALSPPAAMAPTSARICIARHTAKKPSPTGGPPAV